MIKIISSKKLFNENYLIFVFFLLVFKFNPRSYIGDQWANTLVELVIFISLIVVAVINKFSKIKVTKITVFLLTLTVVSQMLWIRIYFGNNIDYKEQFNLLLYLLFFVVIQNLILQTQSINKSRILNKISIIIFMNIIISIAAYLNSNIFSVFNIFFETTKTAIRGNSYQRFSGTFSNPNFFGVFFAVIASCMLYNLISGTMKKIPALFFLLASLYLVNISGSRSGLITFICLGIVTILISFLMNRKVRYDRNGYVVVAIFIIIFLSIILLLITSFQGSISYDNFNTRFFNYENIKENLMGRVNMTLDALSAFTKNPILGVGNNEMHSSIDNQYGKILMESGIIIFIIFIIFLFYLLISRFILFKKEENFAEKNIYFYTFIATIALMINMFGAALFSVTQLTTLYFFLLALNKK
ncbi:O-antigen ligase family protein [Paenibacillus odorifer]|uniref:O-antigen ligase family protein n=1 Tax=Paenibacillus odorifer TaxID=189426 RepID=UPI000BA16300|nr:O-antigen ligase family protein [Paenibacillus odorifer]OZQ71157.1 hypothetical protein CA596_22905 [Paenibacillus odorifer]